MTNRELITEVEVLLAEIESTHRYSMSRIYELSNRVFDKNETPQSCVSCLIRKTNDLKKWIAQQQTLPEASAEKPKRKANKKH